MGGILQFKVGDEVFLMNPWAVRQKAALASISSVLGEHKFHKEDILEGWWRVDVSNVLTAGVALMFPNERADQHRIEDAKGSTAMWAERFIKASS